MLLIAVQRYAITYKFIMPNLTFYLPPSPTFRLNKLGALEKSKIFAALITQI